MSESALFVILSQSFTQMTFGYADIKPSQADETDDGKEVLPALRIGDIPKVRINPS